MQTLTIPQTNNPAEKKETVRELVRRHLQDATHTTTEEELRNVVLDSEHYHYTPNDRFAGILAHRPA